MADKKKKNFFSCYDYEGNEPEHKNKSKPIAYQ